MTKDAARDISYAYSAKSPAGRGLIRAMENATGRFGVIKRADGYDRDVANGDDFWQVMVQRYGLSLDIVGGDLSNIPKNGPLVLIANHPYGILDGLMLGHILARTRGDFRILAHQVFRKAGDLNKVILPISFDDTKDSVRSNIETRKTALTYLDAGGAIGVFPGGTVSTARKPFQTPLDPEWRAFTARMVAKSNATVVPIYFDGHTSRLFQLASHMHANLRMGLLIHEFKKRVDTPVRVVIGDPIAQDALQARSKDAREMMDFLRKATYELSEKPMDALHYGYDFERKDRA